MNKFFKKIMVLFILPVISLSSCGQKGSEITKEEAKNIAYSIREHNEQMTDEELASSYEYKLYSKQSMSSSGDKTYETKLIVRKQDDKFYYEQKTKTADKEDVSIIYFYSKDGDYYQYDGVKETEIKIQEGLEQFYLETINTLSYSALLRNHTSDLLARIEESGMEFYSKGEGSLILESSLKGPNITIGYYIEFEDYLLRKCEITDQYRTISLSVRYGKISVKIPN